jgi:pantoate--beta-alanine ligase
MREARKHGDVVVISIFVNPTQFGPTEDLQRYPRDLERDVRLASEVVVDLIFVPQAKEMYPEDYQTFVEVTKITIPLCGKSRPAFFRGVTTVVTKLFNIVKPHVAVFGEKDFQQLLTVRRLVRDLNMDVEIVGYPIVREEDGLAMSSRNSYLNPGERQTALRLNHSIKEAQALLDQGETRGHVILNRVRDLLEGGSGIRIDYAQLCHPDTLDEVDRIDGPTLLAIAGFVGTTRLIDNGVLRC